MSECWHDWRAVGGPVDGAPPTSEEQHAWCRKCGALRTKTLIGWGVLVPLTDRDSPTIGNILGNALKGRR